MQPGVPATIGPFRVLRRLGAGGMGVVYEAEDPTTGRPVAVKQVLARGADAREVERFLREAEVLARLRHPGVVRVHQLGRAAEGPFLVMERVDGQPLSELVRAGPVEPLRATRIARGVADAVAAVHAAGVLHRDLKPANVLLRPDGSPVLLDFGLARDAAAERLTRTGETLGTPAYMAPEQASGESTAALDERCDVYGVGAVLLELLTGEKPFQGGSWIEVVAKVLRDEPRWPSARGLSLPPGLEAVVRRALAKRPEDRHPSAAALRDDLDRVLAGVAPAAPARAARRAVGAGALALAAALVAALGSAALRSAAPRAAGPAAAPRAVAPAPAAAAPLWDLPAGRRLRYALGFVEEGQADQLQVRFGADVVLEPGAAAAPGEVEVRCTIEAIRCALGVSGLDAGGVAYDSASSGRDHLLAALGASVGRAYLVHLAPGPGAVTWLGGFGPIREAVLAEPHDELDQLLAAGLDGRPIDTQGAGAFARLIRNVLDDAFMRAAMDSLTRVRGPDLRVPWRGAGAGWAVNAARGARILRNLNGAGGGDDVLFQAQARYDDGALEAAEVAQEDVRQGGRLRWSMKRRRGP